MRAIDKDKVIDLIRKMMDIDGFRDGDAVSRRAVIAVIDSVPETDTAKIDLDIFRDDLK